MRGSWTSPMYRKMLSPNTSEQAGEQVDRINAARIGFMILIGKAKYLSNE